MSPLDYLAPFSFVLALACSFVLVFEWQTLTLNWRVALGLSVVVLCAGLTVWGYVDCSGSWQECTR